MKNDNKGFSLIELIVVITIMAILVGVLAPNVLKYVEKSKVAADTQVAETVRTAILTSLLDPTETIQSSKPADVTTFTAMSSVDGLKDSDSGAFVLNVRDIMGGNYAAVKAKLKSSAYKGQDIEVKINSSTGSVEVQIQSAASGTPALVIK